MVIRGVGQHLDQGVKKLDGRVRECDGRVRRSDGRVHKFDRRVRKSDGRVPRSYLRGETRQTRETLRAGLDAYRQRFPSMGGGII